MNTDQVAWEKRLPDGRKLQVFGGKFAWYWRIRSGNGQIAQIGGEPYTRKWNAKRAVKKAAR